MLSGEDESHSLMSPGVAGARSVEGECDVCRVISACEGVLWAFSRVFSGFLREFCA